MAYNAIGVTQIAPDPPYYVIFVLMKDPRFWLCMLITSTTAILPRFVFLPFYCVPFRLNFWLM